MHVGVGIDWIAFSEDVEAEYAEVWRGRSNDYWLARLMQEVGELASSLAGDHDNPPEWELIQIRSIAGNWLKHMQADKLLARVACREHSEQGD